MARVDVGETSKDVPHITRRAFLFWASAVTGSVALSIIFGPRPNQTVSYDSEQNKLANDMQATAAAGQGQPVVGNAPGRFPQRTLDLVRAATNLLIVVYKDGDTVASAGTAWKTEFDGAYATDAHVLTRHGQREISDIDQIWMGRPFSKLGFHVVQAACLKLALPQDYANNDETHDAATIQIARKVTPQWIAAAPGLRLAEKAAVQEGEQVMAAGAPVQYLAAPIDVALQAMPLYATVMQVTSEALVPGGYGLRGEVSDGMSGSSVTRLDGSVAGMVVSTDTQDRYLAIAIPTTALSELAGRL